MNLKKISGLLGIIICVLILALAAFRVITWTLFWVIIILMAGFAYFVLPKIKQ